MSSLLFFCTSFFIPSFTPSSLLSLPPFLPSSVNLLLLYFSFSLSVAFARPCACACVQSAEDAAARLANEDRHLKERLSIESDKVQSEQRVADKADSIALKMKMLADKADKVGQISKSTSR